MYSYVMSLIFPRRLPAEPLFALPDAAPAFPSFVWSLPFPLQFTVMQPEAESTPLAIAPPAETLAAAPPPPPVPATPPPAEPALFLVPPAPPPPMRPEVALGLNPWEWAAAPPPFPWPML